MTPKTRLLRDLKKERFGKDIPTWESVSYPAETATTQYRRRRQHRLLADAKRRTQNA